MHLLIVLLDACYAARIVGKAIVGWKMLAFLVLVGTTPRASHAQSRSVLVLPVARPDSDPVLVSAHASALVSAIASGTHTPIALTDALERFEALGSSEPPSVSESDIERWLALSRQASRDLASMAAPLLLLPITYAVRSALGSGAQRNVSVSKQGAIVQVGGQFR